MTFADVGESAGYSRGLPAAIFGSKDNLIVQAAKRITDIPYDRTLFAARPEDGVPEMLDMVGRWFNLMHNLTHEGVDEVRGLLVLLSVGMISETASRFPELAEVLRSIDDGSRARFRTFLENGKARGQLRPDIDIEAEAIIILGAVRGILWQWLISSHNFDLVQVGEAYTRQLRERLQTQA